MSAQTDMAKAKDMRGMAKAAKSAVAKADFEAAADRLEQRAARGAKKAGKRRRKKFPAVGLR